MLNKIMIIGNLGRDVEMSYTPSGKAVSKFSVAVSRRRTGADGQRVEETTWFNVVAWDRLAETCSQYLHKGSKVYIDGRMTSRQYTDKDNVQRTAWEITASEMEMLDARPAGAGQPTGADDMTADDVPF